MKIPLLTAFMVFLFATVAFSIDIASCPYQINSSGTYNLINHISTGDAFDPNGCIVVNASNVMLNLSGYRIENGTNTAIQVNATFTNVTIKDGNLSNIGSYGLSFVNPENSTAYNITAVNLSYAPLSIDGINITVYGFRIFNSSYYSADADAMNIGGYNITVRDSFIQNVSNGITITTGNFTLKNMSINATYRSLIFTSGLTEEFDGTHSSIINVTGGRYNYSILMAQGNGSYVENATASEILNPGFSNVTIRNITIDNFGASRDGIWSTQACNGNGVGDLVLQNVVVNGSLDGIRLESMSSVNMTNITVMNVIGNNYKPGTTVPSTGINASNGVSNVVRGFWVNVTSKNSSAFGVEILSSAVTMVNSTFISNNFSGILLAYPQGANLTSINASNNTQDGIRIKPYAAAGTIANNILDQITARKNGMRGVRIHGSVYLQFGFVPTTVAVTNSNFTNSQVDSNVEGDVLIGLTSGIKVVNVTFNSSPESLGNNIYPLEFNQSTNDIINLSNFTRRGKMVLINSSSTGTWIAGTVFNGTNVSFNISSGTFILSGEDALPGTPDLTVLSRKMVNVTNISTSAHADVSLHYTDAEIANISEDSVEIYVYKIPTSAWTYVTSQTLNMEGNFATAVDSTTFGTYALFANITSGNTSSSSTATQSSSDDEMRKPLTLGFANEPHVSCPQNSIGLTATSGDTRVAEATVRLIQYEPYEGVVEESMTDENGQISFDLGSRVEGTYQIIAQKSGYRISDDLLLEYQKCAEPEVEQPARNPESTEEEHVEPAPEQSVVVPPQENHEETVVVETPPEKIITTPADKGMTGTSDGKIQGQTNQTQSNGQQAGSLLLIVLLLLIIAGAAYWIWKRKK